MKWKSKKSLCVLLGLTVLLSGTPISALAVSEDGICPHHAEHDENCGYAEAVEGQPCTHEHSEECYQITNCIHTCGEECSEGCVHICSVENDCITMEKDCHHSHNADCGYSEGTAEVPCGHTHDETCGYAPAVEAAPCTHNCEESGCTLNEGGTYTCLHTEHDESCGYTEGSEAIPCTHTHDEACGYAPATDGTPCNHICSVVVGSEESCYKLLCSHAEDGQHDEACGYVAAVEGQPCSFACAECSATPVAEDNLVSVSIQWCSLEFTYTEHWNTETYRYDGGWTSENDTITVKNEGTVDVTVNCTFTPAGQISGSFTKNDFTVSSGNTETTQLQLSGKPTEEMNSSPLGTVSVKIEQANSQ